MRQYCRYSLTAIRAVAHEPVLPLLINYKTFRQFGWPWRKLRTASVGQWPEFLATDPEVRVRFPALPGKKKVVGLERGPLSFVSTTEELLDRKVAAPV
jgi:hypothetical protein